MLHVQALETLRKTDLLQLYGIKNGACIAKGHVFNRVFMHDLYSYANSVISFINIVTQYYSTYS